MVGAISESSYIDQAELAGKELQELTPQEMDKNWNIQNYFGHIKVITTDTKSDRFRRCTEELKKIGLHPENYEVVRGKIGSSLKKSIWQRMVRWGTEELRKKDTIKRLQGQAGCFMSQYKAIKDTVEQFRVATGRLNFIRGNKQTSLKDLRDATNEVRKYSSVLIIEDNTGFGRVTGKNSADLSMYGMLFRKTMKDLKSDWDMFYFMTMNDATVVSENIALLHYGLTTKCFAINHTMYERVLQALEIINMTDKELRPVDHEIASLHASCNAYVALPSLSYRFGSTSEVFSHLSEPFLSKIQNWQPEVNLVEPIKISEDTE